MWTKNGVILKGYDPVAYFKQNQPVKGSPKYSSKYAGAIYHFASEEDKAEFDNAPAKYVPQYGGFCANSMSKDKFADIDPNQFLIYKGKLYVCSSAASLKTFRAKPDLNIQAADKYWEFYQPQSNPGFRRYFGN
ncbi:MAG: YHS domain-containing protein [Verrucomicrobia bacterium]|nr:YHS domain-containing protein [Verrucomicrobiota bacterium]